MSKQEPRRKSLLQYFDLLKKSSSGKLWQNNLPENDFRISRNIELDISVALHTKFHRFLEVPKGSFIFSCYFL